MFRFGDPGGRMYQAMGASNANFLAHWTSLNISGSTTISVVASGGRLTGTCLRFSNGASTGNSAYGLKTLTSHATWGMAFAVKVSAAPTASAPGTILAQFSDTGSNQCDLRIASDLSLNITRNGTLLGNSGPGLSVGTWAHLEWKVTIHPTTGTAQLWINGVPKINLTNQNTRATANSSANGFSLGIVTGANASTSYDIDDLIVYDGQATDANGLADITGPIGDCSLHWLLPSGAGNSSQFTPDSGSNYARVAEATPDGDTSYVSSATVNNVDTYAMNNLSANVTSVKSIAACHYAKKMDATARQIAAQIRSGGTDYTHASPIALSTSYAYGFSNWGQNPNSSAAWTPVDVNALEMGQKLTS